MQHIFKPMSPNDCILQNSRIDIWQYPLHTEFSDAIALLNQDELTRARRYHFARHQRRFTVARAMLRLILARYARMDAKELIFTENKYGKPQLSNARKLQFNLSHSGDVALLAIGQVHPLGIDLEFFAARPYEGIGGQMFSSAENKALRGMSPVLKPLAFFHIWSQKEALIKACGLGLSYPTQQFDVPALPPTNQVIIDTLHAMEWQMVSFMPTINCCAALCHAPQIKQIRYLTVRDVHDITQ